MSSIFKKTFYTNAIREKLGIIVVEEEKSHEENEIVFLMESQTKRKERWLNIPHSSKIRFWRVMINNYYNTEAEERSIRRETMSPFKKLIKIRENNFFEEESWNSSESPVHNKDKNISNLYKSESEESKNESSVSLPFENKRFNYDSSSSEESENSEQNRLIDYPQLIEIKQHQLELWDLSLRYSPNSIYEMWFVGFTHFERVSLWNSLFCSQARSTQIMKDDLDRTKTLKKFHAEVYNIIKLHKRKLKRFKTKKEQFDYLYKKLDIQKEQRILLWFPLTLEEKIIMYLTQKDIKEQDYMAILLFNCEEGKDISTFIEKYLNLLMKTKYLSIAEIKSTMYIIDHLKKCIHDSRTEDFDGYKFICFLVSKLEQMKRVISANYHDLDFRTSMMRNENIQQS